MAARMALLLLVVLVSSVQVARTQICAGQANVVFLVDAAAATVQSFTNSMSFVYSTVSTMAIGTRNILVSVNLIAASSASSSSCQQPSTQYFNKTSQSSLLAAINQSTIDGAASIATSTRPTSGALLTSCLQTALSTTLSSSFGARLNMPNILVVVSSAALVQISDKSALTAAAQSSKANGNVLMFAVYGTPNVSSQSVSDYVASIVTKPSDVHAYSADDDVALSTDTYFQRLLCTEIPVCAGLADVAIVMELTGAIAYWDWLDIVAFVQRVVGSLNIAPNGVHVACVTYDSQPTLQFGFNAYSNRYDLASALNIEYSEGSGGANAAAAFRYLSSYVFASSGQAGNRLAVRQIAIFISDGWSNQQESLLQVDADQVHDQGIEVFSIGVGRVSNYETFESTMKAIASGPVEEHYFNVQTTGDLQSIVDVLVNRTCRLEIPSCAMELDLVFVVDASGNVGPVDILTVLGFITNVVSKLDIDNGHVRVGLLEYATSMFPVFQLGTYTTAQDVEVAVSSRGRYLGESYAGQTGVAFQFARDYMFTAANGSRPGAKHVIILINDGYTTDAANATLEAAKTRSAGISIVAIGVGTLANKDQLMSYASYPTIRNVLVTPLYSVIFQAYDQVVSMICSVDDNCASSPCQNGGNCSNIINGYVCSCPLKTTGVNCQLNCTGLIDVFFLVDGSDFVSSTNFQAILSFIRRMVLGLNIPAGSRVGLVVYGSDAQLIFSLEDFNNVNDVLNAVNAVYPGGGAKMADALRIARQIMTAVARQGVPSSIVLLASGYASQSQLAIDEAVAARDAGIHVIAVSEASSAYLLTLDQVASLPSRDNVIVIEDYAHLPLIDTQLFNGLCSNIDSCASNPCKNGATCRGGFSTYTCLCASGFTGLNCDRFCTNEADIAILVQLSGSVHWEELQNISLFIQNTMFELNLPGRFRISLMYYNDNATILLNLNNQSQINDYISKSSNLPFPSGRTNLANALRTMNRDIFGGPGARPGVPKVAIIMLNRPPTVEYDNTITESFNTQRMGVNMILVAAGPGLNSGANYVFLSNLASYPPTTHFFDVPNFAYLDSLVPFVANATCNEASPCLSNPCQNDGTCTDGIRQFSCQCQDTYSGSLCERECSSPLDIVFVVDVSASLTIGGFENHITVMRTIIQGLNFGKPGTTRVAYITFAHSAIVQFTLGNVTTLQDILISINIDYVATGTDIANALRTAKTVFTTAPPRTNQANSVIVLISDGKANEEIDSTLSTASDLKNMNIVIYTVAIGASQDDELMANIASYPYEPYAVIVNSLSEARNVSLGVLDSLCSF